MVQCREGILRERLQDIVFCPFCSSDSLKLRDDGIILCLECGRVFKVISDNLVVNLSDMEFDILNHDESFRYQLLSRMKMDCDYYLGNGNRCVKYLWAQNEVIHIENMKMLWESFSSEDKPEWLTLEQISEYEKQMIH